jgi:hypothetical protein
MSQDIFQLLYEGADVQQGSMDIYDLAPALLSVSDLVREVNRFLNAERATVSVQVRSDFRRGSFEISLILDQTFVEQAKQILFGDGVIEAKGLVELIFGHPGSLVTGVTAVTGAVMGIIKLYKLLHGQKPSPGSVKFDKSTTIIQNISVEAKTAQLYLNDPIRYQIDRIVRPLGKDGIDAIEVRKDSEVIDRLEKSDIPRRVLQSAKEIASADVLSDTREALLKVIKVDFEEGAWRFSDGTAKFGARINDAVFQEKLDKREVGFYKGDVLRVRLETVQTLQPSGKLKTDYSIEEVLDHQPEPTQRRLPNSKPKVRLKLTRGNYPRRFLTFAYLASL